MTAPDPSTTLARAALWVGELRERGQLEDAAAARLNQTLAESFGERLDAPDDPLLVVMLCGPTAVGKSSLINALAGAEISRPGLGAATRAAVLYVHEEDDPARLFEYSAALARTDQRETELVRHRGDALLHKVLIDTPDIDSVMLQHRELTERLVHAADLVLFVTSPEKYKAMQSARWVLKQRQQRALAFVLNKWDREALGLQRDRREEVADDFRAVLTGEGFPQARIFKVSALTGGADEIHNELPELRAWLETGIDQSTAAIIRGRRLRAAWGRLAAAIEQAAPRPLSNHPLLPEIVERLASHGAKAEQSVSSEALILEAIGLEDDAWPSTPGLLGMWTRTRHRFASTTATLRAGLALLGGSARGSGAGEGATSGRAFGARAAAALAETVQRTATDAEAAHVAIGPVAAAWITETLQLERQLSLLPIDAAAELAAQANRRTLRRLAGFGCVYGVEGLIILVLLVTVWRVGADFVAGVYASVNLFFTVLVLVSILVIIGHTLAAMFFPPLRQRLRRTVGRRAISLVTAAVDKLQTTLRDHVTAVDRLAREGRELLAQIDRAVISLATGAGDETSVNRLFGQEPQSRSIADATVQPMSVPLRDARVAHRRPRFD
jgi:energy-coupling factor transporter ATP-binding protein EcfA2